MKKIYMAVMVLTLISGVSCMTTEKRENATVTVSAEAAVIVIPDTASFSITAEALGKTTEEARSSSSLMIADAVSILRDEFGITDDALTTSYMNISPSYEWRDSSRVLAGQRAVQTLSVTLSGSLENAGRVYDRLSVLDGISISQISYSKRDTSREEAEARRLAAGKAEKTAGEYAQGLGLRLGRLISLSEGGNYSYGASNAARAVLSEAAPADSYTATSYYMSDMAVSAGVTAVFELTE